MRCQKSNPRLSIFSAMFIGSPQTPIIKLLKRKVLVSSLHRSIRAVMSWLQKDWEMRAFYIEEFTVAYSIHQMQAFNIKHHQITYPHTTKVGWTHFQIISIRPPKWMLNLWMTFAFTISATVKLYCNKISRFICPNVKHFAYIIIPK